jgi:hypothetical protein
VLEGRSAEALKAARKAAAQHGTHVPEGLAGFSEMLEALPFLTMVRFGLWEEIAKTAAPADTHPFASAIYHFSRGMAFSAARKPQEAKAELAATKRLASADALRDMKILDLNSLPHIAQIAVAMIEGEYCRKGWALCGGHCIVQTRRRP